MKQKMRRIGALISLQMGLAMGITFSLISMIRQGHIVPMGIVTSALISMAISTIIGFFIPMKKLSEGTAKFLHCDPTRHKFLYNLIEAIIGALVFVPIIATFFIIMNVGIHNPMFVKILLSTLLVDFIVTIPLNLIFCPLFKAVTRKIMKIPSIN